MKNQLSAERDPAGITYIKGQKVFRDIHGEFKDYFLSIINDPGINRLFGQGIVETRIASETTKSLTLEHPLIHPVNYAYEWPLPMLKDAALLTLDLNLALLEKDTVLKDATPWNVLFKNSKPIWVDFTSLMPQEKDLLWVAYDQFCRTFLFPLLIGHFYSGRMARALLLESQNGISPQEITKFLPGSAKFKFGWLNSRVYLPKFVIDLARKSGSEKDLARRSQSINLTNSARRSFFESLKKDVNSIPVGSVSSDWSKYYADINSFFEPANFDAKQRKVAELVEKYKPKTVVDIGCNQGGFSILAAQRGAGVTAFDNDEDSVSLLNKISAEKNLNILSLTGDVLYPAPQCGWRGQEFPSAPVRFRSEMAMALALVHHLAITQIQTFDRIVLTLSEYAEKWLVTEFVPLDDPRSQELLLTNRRDMSWYTFEAFLDSLKKEFAKVTLFPSYPAGRVLCVCERKN
jgi:SAM-dependent methyltransferase